MKKIVILFPTAKEASFFRNTGGIPVHICGVGMAECATTTARVIATERPDLVILAGIAGTYTAALSIGETVAVGSEVVADMGRRSGGEFTPLFQKTYTASVVPAGYRAVPSNTVNCAGALVEQPAGAEIENMEGAAFFAVCAEFCVGAMEIRTVSNRVGEPIAGENLQLSITRLAEELHKIVETL
jgi:nucleoside phosphorylase